MKPGSFRPARTVRADVGPYAYPNGGSARIVEDPAVLCIGLVHHEADSSYTLYFLRSCNDGHIEFTEATLSADVFNALCSVTAQDGTVDLDLP